MKTITCLLTILGIGWACSAAAQLAGTVVDPSGKPVPDVTVTLLPNPATTNRTDAAGRFTLSWDTDQQLGMQANQRVLLVRDPLHNLAIAQAVEEGTTNVALQLEPALTIAGSVTETNGHAIANAKVDAILQVPRMAASLGAPSQTDAEGRFELKGLPAGRKYLLYASANGFGRVGRVVDSPEADKPRVEPAPIQLPPADQHIAGLVVDADDQPVAGASVQGFGGPQPRLNGKTDGKGRFSFDQVCAGPIQLFAHEASGGTPGSVRAQGGDTNIMIRLGNTEAFVQPGSMAKLSGTVTDPDGNPAPKVAVSLFPMSQGERRTDADGHFTLTYNSSQFGGMQFGQRVLIARDPARNLAAAADLEDETTNVNLRLQPALTLAGRATDAQGQAISNAEVSLNFSTDRMQSPMGSSIHADAEGRFEIKALPFDRRYSVGVSAKGFGRDGRMVESPGAETRRVELEPFELPVADQRIAGVVLDSNDQPVAQASIFSYGLKQPNLQGRTDAKGQFSFDRVCAGSISLSANHPLGRGFGNVTAQGGDTNIVIRLSTSSSGRPQVSQRTALKGKPLPDLATVNIASDAVPAGKPVLLCLFDPEQRPSRRMLRLLTEQYPTLRKQGITVLAVQSVVTTAESFQSWKTANRVPFPVGRVAAKSEQIKWAMEVEALPWLILTDADRRVTDEGFGFDELDAKLKAMAK